MITIVISWIIMAEKIYTETLAPGLSFELILVEGGEFWMGSPDDDPDAFDPEKPRHLVKLSSFYMGEFPVTQDLWEAVMGENPSYFKGPRHPVEKVSWEDAQRFIGMLNKKTKGGYRLPTEAEWEYAARGGKHSEGFRYAGSDKLKEVGWYAENSGSETHKVGLKYSNELGLYDMSGNVWEWCQDRWHGDYKGAPADGSAWEGEGGSRVVRGGSWSYDPRLCRVAYRYFLDPALRNGIVGFRLGLSPQSVG